KWSPISCRRSKNGGPRSIATEDAEAGLAVPREPSPRFSTSGTSTARRDVYGATSSEACRLKCSAIPTFVFSQDRSHRRQQIQVHELLVRAAFRPFADDTEMVPVLIPIGRLFDR